MTGKDYLYRAKQILEAFVRVAHYKAQEFALPTPLLLVSDFIEEEKVVLCVRVVSVWNWVWVITPDTDREELSDLYHMAIVRLKGGSAYFKLSTSVGDREPQLFPWLRSLQDDEAKALFAVEVTFE